MPGAVVPPITNNADKVQLARLGHVYFEHPNLEIFAKFAADFGLVEASRTADTVFYRGYGSAPYVYVATKSQDQKPRFTGPAFVARSQEEFDKAAHLPGAKLMDLKGAPGGGQRVTFEREDDTWFHVVYGQEDRIVTAEREPSATHETQGPFNMPFSKPRLGTFQRYHEGPALIHKIGHFGYVHRFFDDELAWYTSNFNLVPSDILYEPKFDDTDVICFMHLDLGAEYSDHHCFFISRAEPGVPKTYLHHTSYEVADVDTQYLGHHWLAKAGWKSVWGVGRHILGSQIFDYWKDPSGFKIEHYCDGDLVNKDHVVGRDRVGPLSIWGPEMSAEFFENELKMEFPEMPVD